MYRANGSFHTALRGGRENPFSGAATALIPLLPIETGLQHNPNVFEGGGYKARPLSLAFSNNFPVTRLAAALAHGQHRARSTNFCTTADREPTPTVFLAFHTYQPESSKGSWTKNVRPYIFYGLCRGAPSIDAPESAQTTPARGDTDAAAAWNERVQAACSLAHTLAGDFDEYAKRPNADISAEALTVQATKTFEALRQSSAAPCSLLGLESTDRQKLTGQITSIIRQGGRQVGQKPSLVHLDQPNTSSSVGSNRALRPRIQTHETVINVPSSAISESSQSGVLGRASLVSADSRLSVVYVSPWTPLGPPPRLDQDFTGLGTFDISVDSRLDDPSKQAGMSASATTATSDTLAEDLSKFQSQFGGFEPF